MKKLFLFIAIQFTINLAFSQDMLTKNAPEELAQEQLEEYNARDIDAFLAPYAEDVELYTFPNELNTKGKSEMRKQYEQMFANTPDLHCELVNRIVNGNTVIDHERITGFSKGKAFEAVAIYKIGEGKIKKVYFIKK